MGEMSAWQRLTMPIIVGGGHNGLVAACYLALGGWKVLVLERRYLVGGAWRYRGDLPRIQGLHGAYVNSLFAKRSFAICGCPIMGWKSSNAIRRRSRLFPMADFCSWGPTRV